MSNAYIPKDDVPIYLSEHDKLNRGKLSNRLVEAIRFGSLPQVMGVEGDWGSGKTSLLQNLFWRIEGKQPRHGEMDRPSALVTQASPRSSLDWARLWSKKQPASDPAISAQAFVDDETIRAVWFEAWRYQNETEPVIALLHEIRAQLLTGDKWDQRSRRLWQKMKTGAEIFVKGLFGAVSEVMGSLSLEAGGEIGIPGVSKGSVKASIKGANVANHFSAASSGLDAKTFSAPLRSDLIRKNLDLAISLFIGDDGENSRRLVIIIDDLDRCAPEAVCRLLESIKIHLDLPSCFFVLGLNRRHVETSITSRLVDAFHSSGDLEKENLLRARASDYVEKICTNLVRIPRPDPRYCVNLAVDCLSDLQWPNGVDFAQINVSFPDFLRGRLTASYFVPLPSNPRRIKALCNQLRMSVIQILGSV